MLLGFDALLWRPFSSILEVQRRRTAKSRIVAITLRRDERPGVTEACLADRFAPIAFGSLRATRTLQFS